MDKEKLAKLIAEKIDAAVQSSEHPKKFFITANGRGVTDGGELYNAVFADVIGVVKVALTDILQELATPVPAPEPKAAPAPAPKPAPAKAQEKLAKNSARK